MAARGLVIAGLSSGSGKTTVTLGLLRALRRIGVDVSAAKTGPDYIDGAYLGTACGSAAVNLDAYAMAPDILQQLASAQSGETMIVEGVMGLFDGTIDGAGSTAHLASQLGLPVILVIDARHQAQTAAALASGIRHHMKQEFGDSAQLAGVILNRIASPRHLSLTKAALDKHNIALFGALPSDETISVPSRHLGLVQAADLAADGKLDAMIENAANLVAENIDLEALASCAAVIGQVEKAGKTIINAPGQRIALANDAAFGFSYRHLLDDWARQGAEILPFSPLQNEAPSPDADFIYLPGGYPELHLGVLSAANNFIAGMRKSAMANIPIYGECGGFMTLGKVIIDANGEAHKMLGLLDLETSFAKRKLHLGYRRLSPTGNAAWPVQNGAIITGHEFHYTSATHQIGEPLFTAANADGSDLGPIGLVDGSVSGSYAHIIA